MAAPSDIIAARGWRCWAPRIVTAAFVPVLLLIVLEAAFRFCGVGFPTDVTVPCTVQGHAAACYNLFFPAPFFLPGNDQDAAGLCQPG